MFDECMDMGLTVAEYYGRKVIVYLNLKPKQSLEHIFECKINSPSFVMEYNLKWKLMKVILTAQI